MRKIIIPVLVGLFCISTLYARSEPVRRGPMVRPMPRPMPGKGTKPAPIVATSPAAKMFIAFCAAKILVIADVQSVKWGPVMESYPMQYTLKVTVKLGDVLRGKLAKDKSITLNHIIVATKQPVAPKGKVVLALSADGKKIISMVPADESAVDLAEISTGKTKDGLFDVFNQAETLVVVKDFNIKWSRMVGESMPPTRSATMSGKVTQALRGGKVGETISGMHIERTMKQTEFAAGAYVLALAKSRGRAMVKQVRKADALTLALAQAAASVPLGWTPNSGPALLCGKGITMKVEKMPPAKKIKWTNPDGDGEYKITITNTNKTAVKVPALLNDGTKILWLESIKVVCQKKAQPAPGAKKLPAKTQPTTLKAGESISCVVNALGLKNVSWPRGGYRIEFRFSIGELSATKSFYYMSRHHDKIRAATVKKFGGK